MAELHLLQIIDTEFLNPNIHYGRGKIDLYKIFPDIDQFLDLSEEEIGAFIIKGLSDKKSEFESLREEQKPYARVCGDDRLSVGSLKYYHPQLRDQIERFPLEKKLKTKIWETWKFLESERYFISTGQDYDVALTSKGEQLAEQTDPELYMKSNKYPWHLLHSNLSNIPAIRSSFEVGHYGKAVANSFQEVERYLRSAFDIKDAKTCNELMGKVSNAMSMPQSFEGESEKYKAACSNLFMGALVLYRHPTTHEHVELSPNEAWHQIMLASCLFYEIDQWK